MQQKKINNGISATAAADCIVPDWLMSRYFFPVKNPPPAMLRLQLVVKTF